MLNSTFEQQLHSFFTQWERLSPEKIVDRSLITPAPINTHQLESFFSNFKIAYKSITEMKKQGLFVNVWQTAGLERNEVRNNQVLKWFFDCNADHGLNNRVLDIFLKSLNYENATPTTYYSYAENYPVADGKNRVDIQIEADDLLLFIEVKIDASEGFEQLKRYQEIALQKAKRKKWAVIYLTKEGNLPNNYIRSKTLIPVSWQTFATAINKSVSAKNLLTHNLWLLKQFAEHINNF